MTPKRISRIGLSRSQPRYCDYCGHHTTRDKSYCTDHIEQQPYVQHILSIISDRENEKDRVRKRGWRAVEINGSISVEIVNFLKVNGLRTARRLAKDLSSDLLIQASYIHALKRAGLVSVDKSKRGGIVVGAI